MVAGFCGNLPREVEASVVHGEDDTVNREALVDTALNEVDGVQELAESFEGKVLALEGDENGIGSGEHIDRQ